MDMKIISLDTAIKIVKKGGEQQVKEESIDDTLLDIANYAVMELLERKNERAD